ncbi:MULTISPECIES: flagellar basal body-associated FliL family protein [unclassified Sphingomonas]|jgi:flagellar FliL protein|uniref:flagellar basal body-associated FliL family protein n=1 Tax=unclassified Sphingomonas TaxID=196159 RepID=UPI00082FF218|nr:MULTISPECIES: flagellar basal body-associated FliL family protein [unclassified Sphingomonas]
MSDAKTDTEKPKKKGGMKKLLLIAGGAILLTGGGAAAGMFLSGSLMGGGGAAEHAEAETPKLVPKSEEKRASLSGDKGGEGGGDHGGGGGEESGGSEHKGKPTPEGEGGDRYASNYYAMDKEFTANLRESVHFVQVGIAISTPYDDRVLENLKTHEIAVRSQVLMTLGETDEEQVFTLAGKQVLQRRLAKAINDVLEEKEGFGGVSNVYFTNFVVQ